MPQISGPFRRTGFHEKLLPVMAVEFCAIKPNGGTFKMRREFCVDTGFTGDLKVPQSVGSALEAAGILGDKRFGKIPSGNAGYEAFPGWIAKVIPDGTEIPMDPQKCVISCMGGDDTPWLVGLDASKPWRICADMRQQIPSTEYDDAPPA